MFLGGKPPAANNDALIDELKLAESVRLKEVEAVMRRVDRANYVMAGTEPYVDRPQSIGFNATISAPHMHAMALEILLPALRGGGRRRALDVGAGSGFLTACMALLQGERGLVVGIEHIPELVAFAESNIRRDKPELLDQKRVKLVVGDGRRGFPDEAPYDAIHVGAAATHPPMELEEQLAPGGRMVVPVGPLGFQQLEVVERTSNGTLKRDKRHWVSFVPLTDAAKQWTRLPAPRRASVVAEMAAAQAVAVQSGAGAAAATSPTFASTPPPSLTTVPEEEDSGSLADATGPRIRRTSLSLEHRQERLSESSDEPVVSTRRTSVTADTVQARQVSNDKSKSEPRGSTKK